MTKIAEGLSLVSSVETFAGRASGFVSSMLPPILAATGAASSASTPPSSLAMTSLLPIVLIASVAGAVIGGAWLAIRHRGESKPFAFGPYLAIAGWIQLMAGDWLLARYYGWMGL